MKFVLCANVVGSLMYLIVCTRPDTSYAMSTVSGFIANPVRLHWVVVKWILIYLNGSKPVGLVFGNRCSSDEMILGYVDADFAKDSDRGMYITCYGFKVLGGMVSWKATLQKVVALSTTEAEYMALIKALKEALWLNCN